MHSRNFNLLCLHRYKKEVIEVYYMKFLITPFVFTLAISLSLFALIVVSTNKSFIVTE